ncbi:MAG TPA: HAMP domain-containing sensor histidine kinase [Polyangiaceae bacterium]|jgi:signal transduction histidine kinase|nr:HAMP domain-containing sensor histidine kinase [Polyangiaceae bacterium]
MAVAIVGITALAYWDARREAERALSDFAAEQATLAQAIAAAVSSHVLALGDAALSADARSLLSDARHVEQPGRLLILLARPLGAELQAVDDQRFHSDAIARGLANGAPWVKVERAEAETLSLPRRMAVAGIATFAGPRGKWSIVVLATALRERDRQARAQWRFIVGVGLASSLVLAFGGLARRKQRKELELERELTVAELVRDREKQLVQIDKLATMATLANGIAHEVSTPLGVIVGRAEQLLPKVEGDERAHASVTSIIEQGTRINLVVRGFLNLARGEFPPLEWVSPRVVAEASRELVEHRFDDAGVTLSMRIGVPLPDIACDPRLIEQVLINLLLNACDACTRGGNVELEVLSDGERVCFVVTDDGAGIAPEALERAAEPFFTTKPVGKGTGLGLAIATEIVKHHGGKLTLGARAARDGSGSRGTRAAVELAAKESS